MAAPLAYLITFTCYGTRLYGDPKGSVDRAHSVYGTPWLRPNPNRVTALKARMIQAPYELDSGKAAVVLKAIQDVCACRGWTLFAAHVRSNHVHLVVSAQEKPARILGAVKAYASRALNKSGFDDKARKRWSHHGSTRYLWKPAQVGAAKQYVVHGQGKPMAVWESAEALL